jgi:two-component system nitrogen regulation sensor histidine kinase GlnL
MQSLDEVIIPQLTFVTRVERLFTVGARQHKIVIKVDIIDNGQGIPETLKEHLFFPMISGRSSGTGLGLSVAQSIIHQYQGMIEFESEPGRTAFSVIIPLEQQQ